MAKTGLYKPKQYWTTWNWTVKIIKPYLCNTTQNLESLTLSFFLKIDNRGILIGHFGRWNDI